MQRLRWTLAVTAMTGIGAAHLAAQPFPPPAAPEQPVVIKVPGVDPALAENLANGTVGVAAKRLSLNPADLTGRRLLQFAAVLDNDNPNLRYLAALVNLGKPIDPAKIPVNVTEDQYIGYLLKLANLEKPSYYRLLLYNVVGMLDSTQRVAITELYRARENGLVADFAGVIKRLNNTFPILLTPPKPLLAATMAKSLADGASKLAEQKFRTDGRQSEAGLYLMQFAVAIDPSNENAFFLKAMLLGNHPLQEIASSATGDAYFDYLKKIVQTIDHENIRLLLHHILLIKNPEDPLSITSLKSAQSRGKDIKFQSLIESLNRQTASAAAATALPILPPNTPPLDERLKNSRLRDTLVSRKWTFNSLTTQQQWFFEFIPIGKAIEARGNCRGRRGNHLHSWKSWEVRDSILIIDGYVKFKYDERRRQWIPLSGPVNMYFR